MGRTRNPRTGSLAAFPNDAGALLALGVAMQRTRRFDVARTAFDSALAALDARERAHLTSMRRVLPTQDDLRAFAWVNYQYGIVYVRFVGTHRDYDRIDAQRVCSGRRT